MGSESKSPCLQSKRFTLCSVMFAIDMGKILVVESTDVNHTVVFFTSIAHFEWPGPANGQGEQSPVRSLIVLKDG